MHRNQVLALHALAHDIATGERNLSIRWYSPPDGSRLYPVPVLPQAIHDVMCNCMTSILDDVEQQVYICQVCHIGVGE